MLERRSAALDVGDFRGVGTLRKIEPVIKRFDRYVEPDYVEG